MKFADVENVWTVDVKLLSNADRGRVYYERAKQAISEALADPKVRPLAVEGRRFRRAYLIEKIGCAASAPTQNPKIKALLSKTDRCVAEEASRLVSVGIAKPTQQATEIDNLRSAVVALQRRVNEHAEVIAELKRKPHKA